MNTRADAVGVEDDDHEPATVEQELRRATKSALVGVVIVVLIGLVVLILILTLVRPALGREASGGRALRLASRDMLDMDTGSRRYLLTDDRAFLEPYETGRRSLPDRQEAILRFLGEDDATADAAQLLIDAQEAWIAFNEPATVERIEALGPFLGESKELFDVYRDRTLALEDVVDASRRRRENQQYRLIVGGLLTQAATGAVAYGLTVRSARQLDEAVSVPVRGLYDSLVRLRSGDPNVDMSRFIGGPLEVRELGVILVETAEALGRRRALDEAHRQALEQAKDEADHANAAKSAFLSTMSHEIRTPLNGVIGMTGMLMETPLNETQREYADIIRNNGDLLLLVINDVLDFSKIEAGHLDLEVQPFDVRDCVESALDTVAPQAAGKDLDLVYFAEPDTVVDVVGDTTRLRQVLVNLVGNAIKFTEHGEILITVTTRPMVSDQDHLELAIDVRDTGVGIPADRLGALFQPFTQADASTTRRYGGTGLGLAISRRLVEAMGGQLRAESEHGVGSTFSLSVVVGRAAEPVRSRRHEHERALRGRRVLVVDDNATNRRVLCHHLSGWGMEVSDTADPREALHRVRDGARYDLYVLDMHMPDMDGATLCRALRETAGGREPTVVLLSSLGRAEPNDGGCFDAQLSKPVKPGHLHDVLNGVLRKDLPRPAGPVTTAVTDVGPSLRVLVADDNTVNQRVAVGILTSLGHRSDVVGNGCEAVEAVLARPYDVILMDVYMPEMDGLEATGRIRAELPPERQPVIVALSAGAFSEERERCRTAGMDHFVAKPVRPDDLEAVLHGVEPRDPIPHLVVDTVADGTGGAIDASVLDELREALGPDDGDVVAEIIADYIGQAGSLADEIWKATGTGSVDRMRAAAHKLKGGSATVGASRLAALCDRIERTEERPSAMREVAQQLVGEVVHVRAALAPVAGELAEPDGADRRR